jgi:hypothetical protein
MTQQRYVLVLQQNVGTYHVPMLKLCGNNGWCRAVTWGRHYPTMKLCCVTAECGIGGGPGCQDRPGGVGTCCRAAIFQEKENNNNNSNNKNKKKNQTFDPFAPPCIETTTMIVMNRRRDYCCVVCARRRIDHAVVSVKPSAHPYWPRRRISHAVVSTTPSPDDDDIDDDRPKKLRTTYGRNRLAQS